MERTAEDAGGSGGREGVSSTDVEGRDAEREGRSFSRTGGGAGRALEKRERAGDFGVLGMLLLLLLLLLPEPAKDMSTAMAGRWRDIDVDCCR